ncbi:hypothetical protein RclHR1_10710002 [Rhizophagus clarus]|uniref:Uncharacterized protein n=1 Tax=Rhizophagus clarus TaxID=94130 RepID=A0A2Z6Q2B2_9GLOM|nr:hypothetical protein RclHR1_10710002 [Rhizophagus clarus]
MNENDQLKKVPLSSQPSQYHSPSLILMIHNTQNGEDDNTQSPPYKSHKDASNDLEKNDIEIGATQDEVTG